MNPVLVLDWFCVYKAGLLKFEHLILLVFGDLSNYFCVTSLLESAMSSVFSNELSQWQFLLDYSFNTKTITQLV